MRLEPLRNLIASSDFISFKEIAVKCLSLSGYKNITETDGWKDGGIDFRFCNYPPNPSKLGIQVSIEKDWHYKLRRDAVKVKNKFKITRLLFVSSRRIPEVEFSGEFQYILNNIGVTVLKIDNQAIATTFYNNERTDIVLDILGIKSDPKLAKNQSIFNPRANLANAYFFFGRETSELRSNIINSAIISSLADNKNTLRRDKLCELVVDLLNLREADKLKISANIDRMIQYGELNVFRGQIKLPHKEYSGYLNTIKIRENSWKEIKNNLELELKKYIPKIKITDDELESILQTTGALVLDSSLGVTKQLTKPDKANDIIHHTVLTRIKELNVIFDTIGFDRGEERNKFLEWLTKIVSESEVGKGLLTGEILVSISNLSSKNLVKAFGGRINIRVLLDASVAIPILCSLLYNETSNRFGFLSKDFYELSQQHDLELILPLDYLQETASHLIWAFRDYYQLVETESDLAASENAFVAHYVSLKLKKNIGKFEDYIEGFGFLKKYRSKDLYKTNIFWETRDLLMPKLQSLYENFNIRVRPIGQVSPNVLKRAQTAVSYAMNELGLNRVPVLLNHDARTIAHLIQQDKFSDYANVLCTWDSLHFKVRADEDGNWETLDPAVLSDLLSICVDDNSGMRAYSPINIVKLYSEKSIRNAAHIWDSLIQFEKQNIHNATIIQKIREFKESFLARRKEDLTYKRITGEWQKWKQSH